MGKGVDIMEAVSAISAKEALEVIYNSDIDIYTKIPDKLICLLREVASECEENVVLKDNTEIINQSISDEAKAILAIIYKDCIANKEERDRLNKVYIDNQEEMYSVDNIFKNNKNENLSDKQGETALIKVDDEKWYKKIIKFLKKICTISKKGVQ